MRNELRPSKVRERTPHDITQQFLNHEPQRSYDPTGPAAATTTTTGEPKKKKAKINEELKEIIYADDDDGDYNVGEDPKSKLSNEEMEKTVAFCCYKCRCSEEKKELIPSEDPFIYHDNGLYHRRCCHNAFECDPKWKPDYKKAEDTAIRNSSNPSYVSPKSKDLITVIPMSELISIHNNAIRQESRLYNDDGLADPFSVLDTYQPYVDYRKRFLKFPPRSKAVVLDMFAGIGSAIIVLKRLGIAMKLIIHVEHDPVANHVYKWNHDCTYNEKLPDDGIKHVYVEKFERVERYVENHLQKFMETYGPFDIIVGGPPCIDYSAVNANREGVHGFQGSYMPRFGKLIQKIQDAQPKHPIFFLAENAIIRNDEELNLRDGDLETVKRAFRTDWSMDVDALWFSPCRRNRTYISSIPATSTTADHVLDEKINSSTYLSDNFVHCEHVIEPCIVVKVNTFMASKGRIDAHPAMSVVKDCKDEEGTQFIQQRPYNVMEREKIMGFPIGYVGDAVKDLFQNLKEAHSNILEEQPYWKDKIPKIYHDFGGRPCKIVGTHMDDKEPIHAKLCPPTGEKKSQQFYDEQQYGKRLIGNAFSIPVVEILLRSLKDKFLSTQYAGYDYEYVWRTNSTVPNVAIKEEDDYLL